MSNAPSRNKERPLGLNTYIAINENNISEVDSNNISLIKSSNRHTPHWKNIFGSKKNSGP